MDRIESVCNGEPSMGYEAASIVVSDIRWQWMVEREYA